MKKFITLALAIVLALLPVSALAFTAESVPEVAQKPITLAARLVDYQEGPFGTVYAEPPTNRRYIVNERVAVLVELKVPEGYDVADLSLATDADGIVMEPATMPIKTGQYVLYGRLTSASASLVVRIKDARVKPSMGEITVKGHTVVYETGKYTIDNTLTILLDADGRGEAMEINGYTAALINNAVGFIGTSGNILPDDLGYTAIAKTFNTICKDLGLALANVGNYVPANHFLRLQTDRGESATVEIMPQVAPPITVPDVTIDPPKTGDGPAVLGLIMLLAAVIGGAYVFRTRH